MPGNTSDSLANVLEAKGVKFNFTTGNVKYEAVMYKDRHSYERVKSQQVDPSLSSTSSTASSSTTSGSSAKAAN